MKAESPGFFKYRAQCITCKATSDLLTYQEYSGWNSRCNTEKITIPEINYE